MLSFLGGVIHEDWLFHQLVIYLLTDTILPQITTFQSLELLLGC